MGPVCIRKEVSSGVRINEKIRCQSDRYLLCKDPKNFSEDRKDGELKGFE